MIRLCLSTTSIECITSASVIRRYPPVVVKFLFSFLDLLLDLSSFLFKSLVLLHFLESYRILLELLTEVL